MMKTKREFLKECAAMGKALVEQVSRGAKVSAEMISEDQPWKVRIIVKSAESLTAEVRERMGNALARNNAFMTTFPANNFAAFEREVEEIDVKRSAIVVAFFWPPFDGAVKHR